MTPALYYVVYAAALTLLSLLAGSFFRNRLWTPQGMKIGVGNREQLLPPTALSGRADRAAMNTLENFVVFAALVLTAHAGGVNNDQVTLGAAMFFWARLAYWLVYLMGITHVRSLFWVVGVVGMIIIALQMF